MKTLSVSTENMRSCALTHAEFKEFAKELASDLPLWVDYARGTKTTSGVPFDQYDPWNANGFDDAIILYIVRAWPQSASNLSFLEWRGQVGLVQECEFREVTGYPVATRIHELSRKISAPEVDL